MKEAQDLFTNTIDYKKLAAKLLYYKAAYISCVISLLIIAFMINHFSVARYSNKTSIYLNDNSSNSLLNSPDELMSFGMFGNQKIVDNELEVLTSFWLIRSVFNDMDMKVAYYSTKNNPVADLLIKTPFTRKTEHYNDCPIRVIVNHQFATARLP